MMVAFSATAWRNDHIERGHRTEKNSVTCLLKHGIRLITVIEH